MGLIKKKRCRNCKRLFVPDYRNRDRQNYCDKPECKQASKTESQKKWLAKPDNENYFSGPLHVARVQEWRKANPGYWKRIGKNRTLPLQDSCEPQPLENKHNNGHFTNFALQDTLAAQHAVIIGLIAQITGTALQENIEDTLRQMQQLGQDVLSSNPKNGGYHYDCKVCDLTKPTSQSP